MIFSLAHATSPSSARSARGRQRRPSHTVFPLGAEGSTKAPPPTTIHGTILDPQIESSARVPVSVVDHKDSSSPAPSRRHSKDATLLLAPSHRPAADNTTRVRRPSEALFVADPENVPRSRRPSQIGGDVRGSTAGGFDMQAAMGAYIES